MRVVPTVPAALVAALSLGCATGLASDAEELEPCTGEGCSERPGGGEGDGSGLGGFEESDGEGDGESTTTGPRVQTGEVCFPGDGTGELCLPIYQLDPRPAELVYPGGPGQDYFDSNPMVAPDNYRSPIGFIDAAEAFDDHGDDVKIYPNFRLDEIAQRRVGGWAVIQPQTYDRLQVIRDAFGPTSVISGYRSPAYNTSVDGAQSSRHMWGDAVDFDPPVSLATAQAKCEELGAYFINQYTTHIHCDWRHEPVDERFFGPAEGRAARKVAAGAGRAEGPHDASIAELGGGELEVLPVGFDEGEPVVEWHARDASGEIIAVGDGLRFTAPVGTVRVHATVAGWLTRELAL